MEPGFAAIARIAVLAGVGLAAAAPRAAVGQTETVLYSFNPAGADGGPQSPAGKLLLDAARDLIGTTYSGGAKGRGTLYELSPAGVLSILHDFAHPEFGPGSGVTADAAGNVYGATLGNSFNNGSVYRFSRDGSEQAVTVALPGPSEPQGEPLIDRQGSLALTSTGGGAANDGTVFTVTPSGAVTVLYSFTGVGGSLPMYGKLAMDTAGNFYGTTNHSNQTGGDGTVFEVTPAGVHMVLYDFSTNPLNYFGPNAGLLRDTAGNLYGTLTNGGPAGVGCVYKLSPARVFSVIYSFKNNEADGVRPNGGLIEDAAGNLYGTTQGGGANGAGTVFEVTQAGVETILHSFGEAPDAGFPTAGVIMDRAGTLYGAAGGGAFNGGAIYKITR